MEFSPADVVRLYGKQLFQLPEEPLSTDPVAELSSTAPAPDLTPYQSGEAVQWKMKPEAQLALVLSQHEFTDRALTQQLKAWILAAGISPESIGFGTYPSEAKNLDFRQMPVSLGLVFQAGTQPEEERSWDQIRLYCMPSLAEIGAQAPAREALMARLRSLQEILSST